MSIAPDLEARVVVSPDAARCGARAAAHAADLLRRTLAERGAARLTLATGASQFDLLAGLVRAPGVAWSRVTVFHLDEYLGLPAEHPAAFRRYLRERFLDAVPEPVAGFCGLDGMSPDPLAECRRVGALIASEPVDVALCGIGENGHLAFNDPPADFVTREPFVVVALDEACRRQQVGEGWFASLADVPTHALSMSIHQLLASRAVVCTVPELRKARAVAAALEGPISAGVPASALQRHDGVRFFLDRDSASQLSGGSHRG